VPEEMMAGSILAPLPEVEDGCETPRPASPQSVAPSPHPDRTRTPTGLSAFCKQAKLFLTIDEVTVWFPLGLENESSNQQVPESTIAPSGMDFKPPNIGEDSIFAEMPGSFSNYAHASTHRRKPSMEASARRHPMLKSERFEPTSKQSQEKRICSPSISIEVGSVATHMDLSTGRIMYGMLARVLDAIAGKPDTQAKEQKTSTKPEDTNSSFDISVKSLGVAWLETIMAESLLERDIAFRKLALNPQDAIFRVNLGWERREQNCISANLYSPL
jgi:autophagy-related protein 2